MKSREISQSKIGPFSLACTDPYMGIGWEYQFIKNKCFGYSLESPRRGEAILMSTNNICFIENW